MVVDSPDTDAVGLQPVVNQINVFAIFEVKGEVRAGGFISRSEQGQTIPTFSSFAISTSIASTMGGAVERPFGYLHVVLRDCDNDEARCAEILFASEGVDGVGAEQRQAIEMERKMISEIAS